MNCLRRANILTPAQQRAFSCPPSRLFHSSPRWKSLNDHDRGRGLTNILADDNPPAVQVKRITNQGIQLVDGLVLPSACIFLEGQVFLWDVPQTLWEGWRKEHLEIFDLVFPRPEILLLGTGARLVQPPQFIRTYMSQLGVQVDTMDTKNACSTYNVLAEEGRRVAAALLPLSPHLWQKTFLPSK
ncbi:NADH dehydrogenase 1 alpha subcomplex assembly factor 3 [Desarmillaria ectypa]|nr:NADH dehydrogenase 1 alpha subcomplex assembly factor 3 [Desarmillaria ectypa]